LYESEERFIRREDRREKGKNGEEFCMFINIRDYSKTI